MKIVERADINTSKWDHLVDSTATSTFFSYAWYLDAVAENWCAIIGEDYSYGIALPYSRRLGVETLYTPIFCRYIEWLGSAQHDEKIKELILERFKSIDISIRTAVLGEKYETYVFQEIQPGKRVSIGSQAKRMLGKAKKSELSIQIDDEYTPVLKIIQRELSGKIKGMDAASLPALEKLMKAGKENGVIKVYHNVEGGIVCFQNDKGFLYLKGTVSEELKKKGGMYLALNSAIEKAEQNSVIFDFGGSRVKGVRQFNLNLGGNDVEYCHYTIDRSPIWFKFARRLKRKWKK